MQAGQVGVEKIDNIGKGATGGGWRGGGEGGDIVKT